MGLSHRVRAIQKSHGHKSLSLWCFLFYTSCFILDVEVEFLQVCGPLLMLIILQFSLSLHELQWLMINVVDCLLLKNVISPLAVGLHNGVHFFVVSRVLMGQNLIVSHYDRPQAACAE
jgi:hypothetical protein